MLLEEKSVVRATCDQCLYGCESEAGDPVKKPTTFMTNSPEVARELQRRCQGRGGACSRPQGGRRPVQGQNDTHGRRLPLQALPRHPSWGFGTSYETEFARTVLSACLSQEWREKRCQRFCPVSTSRTTRGPSSRCRSRATSFPGQLDRTSTGPGVGEGCEEEGVAVFRRQGCMGATTH